MTERLDQLYQEVILEHNKNPKNFCEIDNANAYAHGLNPLCGDDYQLFLKVAENDLIEDVSFTGCGCAISKSSASMMTSTVKGKSIADAKMLRKLFHQLVTAENLEQENKQALGKLKIFAGVKKFPMRVKCATLIWHALEDALNDIGSIDKTKSISTE